MRFWIFITVSLLCLAKAQVMGAPVDGALQQELLGLYDRYGKLIVAAKMADAAQLRTAEPRAALLGLGKKSKREQQEMKEMARLMTPDEVTAVHATQDAEGNGVTIITMASKTWPAGLKFPNAPKPGTVTHGEVT